MNALEIEGRDADVANALVWLTEHPNSTLMRVPMDSLSEAEAAVRCVLELLAHLSALGIDYESTELLTLLSQLDSAWIRRLDASLLSIGAHRTRRRLALLARWVMDIDHSAGPSIYCVSIDRFVDHERDVYRLVEAVQSHAPDLRRRLLSHARSAPSLRVLIEARRISAVSTTMSSPLLHALGRAPLLGCTVILLRMNAMTRAMLEAWFAKHGMVHHYSNAEEWPCVLHRIEQPNSYDDAIPEGVVYGARKRSAGRYIPTWDALCAAPDDTFSALTQAYDWALCGFPGTMQETIVAWVSADAALNKQFVAHLSRASSELVSAYYDTRALHTHAQGVTFAEFDHYGDAALVAADTEGCDPYLVVEFHEPQNRWWQTPLSQLRCMNIAQLQYAAGRTGVLAAYKVSNRAAYRAIWAQLDGDHNVASATVSGHAPIDTVLQAIGDAGFLETCDLSARCGWAYQHVWGGGAGEHQALFHAQDPRVARAVYDYSMGRYALRDSTCLAVRW